MGVALSGSSSPAPEESDMEDGNAGVKLRLARVWGEVQEVLMGVVCGVVGGTCWVDWLRLTACALGGHWDQATAADSKDKKEGGGQDMLELLVGKTVALLSCVVGVASCEDVEEIVAQLEDQVSTVC